MSSTIYHPLEFTSVAVITTQHDDYTIYCEQDCEDLFQEMILDLFDAVGDASTCIQWFTLPPTPLHPIGTYWLACLYSRTWQPDNTVRFEPGICSSADWPEEDSFWEWMNVMTSAKPNDSLRVWQVTHHGEDLQHPEGDH